MFADRAKIIIRSGKAETDMYPSVVRNTCRTEVRMAEMAAKVET